MFKCIGADTYPIKALKMHISATALLFFTFSPPDWTDNMIDDRKPGYAESS